MEKKGGEGRKERGKNQKVSSEFKGLSHSEGGDMRIHLGDIGNVPGMKESEGGKGGKTKKGKKKRKEKRRGGREWGRGKKSNWWCVSGSIAFLLKYMSPWACP